MILEAVIVVQLGVIILQLWKGRKVSVELPTTPATAFQSRPHPPEMIPHRVNLHETLRKDREGRWVHHGWVEPNSPAWEKAYTTPDQALKVDGAVIEGVQACTE